MGVIVLFLLTAVVTLYIQSLLIRHAERSRVTMIPVALSLLLVTGCFILCRGGWDPFSESVAAENRALGLLLVPPAFGALSGCLGAVVMDRGLPFCPEVIDWLRNTLVSVGIGFVVLALTIPNFSFTWPTAMTNTFYGVYIFTTFIVCRTRPRA